MISGVFGCWKPIGSLFWTLGWNFQKFMYIISSGVFMLYMKESIAGSTGCVGLICSGAKLLKSARCVSQVMVYGSSEKVMIWYTIPLLLTVLSDDVMTMLSWFSNCGEGVTIPVVVQQVGHSACYGKTMGFLAVLLLVGRVLAALKCLRTSRFLG